MNFRFFKKYQIYQAIEKNLKKREILPFTGEFKTVGILLNLDQYDGKENLARLTESLGILSKDLKIICYTEKQSRLPVFEQNFFTPKDFSWNGTFNNPAIEEFLQREYDIFIGYFDSRNYYIDYVASQVRAALNIGFTDSDQRMFDFLFKMNLTDFSLFEKEFVKYIQIFRKNTLAI